VGQPTPPTRKEYKMKNKYLVKACKDININGEWFMKTIEVEVEAEDETDAEWKIREDGFSPIITRKI
jgi:hypothetical protein